MILCLFVKRPYNRKDKVILEKHNHKTQSYIWLDWVDFTPYVKAVTSYIILF